MNYRIQYDDTRASNTWKCSCHNHETMICIKHQWLAEWIPLGRRLLEHIYEICQRLLTWHWQYCANVQIPCMYTVWSDHLRWILWGWSAINWTCSRSLRSVSSKTECFTVFAVSDLIENRLVIYNIYQTKMGESSKKIQVSLMKIQYMYYSPIMTKTKLCNVFSRSE